MNKLGICLSFLFQFTLILAFKSQGLLFTWKEESEPFDSKSEPVGILKNGSNIICTSLESKLFCFMHKGVAQKLSLPCPLENQILNGHKSANFKAGDFSFWI